MKVLNNSRLMLSYRFPQNCSCFGPS